MEKRLTRNANTAKAVPKPAGGFVFITGTALLNAWWAYRGAMVTLRDLRVWLASFEVLARRCLVNGSQSPEFTIGELTALAGSTSPGSVRRSLSRLKQVGLLTWSKTRVQVGDGLQDASESVLLGLGEALEAVPHHCRRIPVPRRMLRMLAKGGTRAIIATAFGHALRCLYYRRGRCFPTGTCKASWIAETFDVDIRNVKAARKELAQCGVLAIERRSQWFLNRHGSLVTVNLAWSNATASCHGLPPPANETRHASPPPNIGI